MCVFKKSPNRIKSTEHSNINAIFANQFQTMNWQQHISSNPSVLYGKPVIVNTRIPVDLILEKLGAGQTNEDLLKAYPAISLESIHACFLFAAESLKSEIIIKAA